ncbi:MAG: hypothetical protein HY321_09025 [Armatimonadetes bacterium]|nr:hypothetical protein [Armatimonadota bacterium]
MAKSKSLTLAALLLCASVGAGAAPSMLGPTGTLLLPDARVLPMGQLVGTGGGIWVDRAGTTDANEWYSLNAGVLPRVEAGVSRVTYRTRRATGTPIHAKFQVLPERGYRPGLAVGSVDLTNETSSQGTAYVTVSGPIWAPLDLFTGEAVHPLRAVAGIGTGIYGGSPFAGLDWQAHNRARLIVEYTKFSPLGISNSHVFNLGGQFTFGNSVVINAGAVDMRYPAVSASLLVNSLW